MRKHQPMDKETEDKAISLYSANSAAKVAEYLGVTVGMVTGAVQRRRSEVGYFRKTHRQLHPDVAVHTYIPEGKQAMNHTSRRGHRNGAPAGRLSHLNSSEGKPDTPAPMITKKLGERIEAQLRRDIQAASDSVAEFDRQIREIATLRAIEYRRLEGMRETLTHLVWYRKEVGEYAEE